VEEFLMPKFKMATANTHYGRMIRSNEGLDPLAEAEADIIALQEIRDPESDIFAARLERHGYKLVHAVGISGLALAMREGVGLQHIPSTEHTQALRAIRPFEQRLYDKGSRLVGQFPGRSMIAAKFMVENETLCVATAHPVPPSRPRQRRVQVNRVGEVLTDSYYDGNLIVAGDWNHFPAARPTDIAMRNNAGLKVADIGSTTTWGFRGQSMESTARVVSMLTHPGLENLATRGDACLDTFDAQLDAILYRGDTLRCLGAEVMEIASDHKAIVASFSTDGR
jgi:endonuclease/exonuclease/phosphatase (EEP) superfamily protein YafD